MVVEASYYCSTGLASHTASLFASVLHCTVQAYRDNAASALSAAKQYTQQSSELGDERPIAGCEFSPDGSRLATCGA